MKMTVTKFQKIVLIVLLPIPALLLIVAVRKILTQQDFDNKRVIIHEPDIITTSTIQNHMAEHLLECENSGGDYIFFKNWEGQYEEECYK